LPRPTWTELDCCTLMMCARPLRTSTVASKRVAYRQARPRFQGPTQDFCCQPFGL
jgi:hypothetical protein